MTSLPARRAAEVVRKFRESIEALELDELDGESLAAAEVVLEKAEDLTAALAVLLESLGRRAGFGELGHVSEN